MRLMSVLKEVAQALLREFFRNGSRSRWRVGLLIGLVGCNRSCGESQPHGMPGGSNPTRLCQVSSRLRLPMRALLGRVR